MVPLVKCPPVCIVPGLEMVAPVERALACACEYSSRGDPGRCVCVCACVREREKERAHVNIPVVGIRAGTHAHEITCTNAGKRGRGRAERERERDYVWNGLVPLRRIFKSGKSPTSLPGFRAPPGLSTPCVCRTSILP
jgi:hypothetical protein